LNDEGTKAVRNLVAIFIGTLFLYITLYGGCAAARQRGGPWVVIQGKGTDGQPWMRIGHHRILGTNEITLTFPGETAPARFTNDPYMRIFNTPNTNGLPYGPALFVDVTFFPGTVALDAFGHLIEMVPRTMYLDGHEIPWVPGTNIVVPTTGKLPPDKRPVRKPAR
jgi:hypothetical protein